MVRAHAPGSGVAVRAACARWRAACVQRPRGRRVRCLPEVRRHLGRPRALTSLPLPLPLLRTSVVAMAREAADGALTTPAACAAPVRIS